MVIASAVVQRFFVVGWREQSWQRIFDARWRRWVEQWWWRWITQWWRRRRPPAVTTVCCEMILAG